MAMAHIVDKETVERANAVLLLSVVWGAIAACVIAAMVFEIGYWVDAW
jgi:hypothetical protein